MLMKGLVTKFIDHTSRKHSLRNLTTRKLYYVEANCNCAKINSKTKSIKIGKHQTLVDGVVLFNNVGKFSFLISEEHCSLFFHGRDNENNAQRSRIC